MASARFSRTDEYKPRWSGPRSSDSPYLSSPNRHRALLPSEFRNRIIEYLELASSFEAQQHYREHVPIAHVPNEVINQWEDWVPTPPTNAEWDDVVYSADELTAIETFNSTWDRVVAAMPNELQTLEQVQTLAEWTELRDAATAASAVLNRRGQFPEGQEI